MGFAFSSPVVASPVRGQGCSPGGLQVVSAGLLYRCVKNASGFHWDSGARCETVGQQIRVSGKGYVCVKRQNIKFWMLSTVANLGTVIFDAQGLDSRCESGKSGVHTSIPISIRGSKIVSTFLHSGREEVELASGKYSIKLASFFCSSTKYLPIKNSLTVNVQAGKSATVILRYEVDTEDKFDREFKRLTKLDSVAWNEKHVADPLTYKLNYDGLKRYARGALCSYIATGLDDFTLGSYISNEVSYDMDIQSALLKATRVGYGCRSA